MGELRLKLGFHSAFAGINCLEQSGKFVILVVLVDSGCLIRLNDPDPGYLSEYSHALFHLRSGFQSLSSADGLSEECSLPPNTEPNAGRGFHTLILR